MAMVIDSENLTLVSHRISFELGQKIVDLNLLINKKNNGFLGFIRQRPREKNRVL